MKVLNGALAAALALCGWAAVSAQTPPAAAPVAAQAPAASRAGQDTFSTICASCHEGNPASRAPSRVILSLLSTESIYRALTDGAMKSVGEGLGEQQKRDVAQYVTGRPFGLKPPAPFMCSAATARLKAPLAPDFINWGFDPGNTHSRSTAAAGISSANVGTLKLKWALAFPNAVRARSQPLVAGRAIFVGSQDGTVFALDRETGCAFWTFHARAEVRTGMVLSPAKGSARQLLYFGDLVGNVYALNPFTGRQAWSVKVEDHSSATMTGTPSLWGGTLYVPVSSLEEAAQGPNRPCCEFRGSVAALDAATGTRRWQTYMTPPPVETGKNARGLPTYGPSGVAIWNAPTIDPRRQRIYVGTGDNYSEPVTATSDAIVALDMKDGKIAWISQTFPGDIWPGDGPDFDFGASPVLATAANGQQMLVSGQKSGTIFGMDPANGKVLWQNRVGRGGISGGVQFGIAVSGDRVFAPIHDRDDGRTYERPRQPGIYALDIHDGKRLWDAPLQNTCGAKTACYPGYAGAISATPDLVFAGSIDGYVRAYDSRTGRVAWEFDTAQEFRSVNGEIARGGSMGGGSAPIPTGGLLIVNSGYAAFSSTQKAGNALLVFEVQRGAPGK